MTETGNPFDLTGHVAVITGGNSSIGLVMFDALAAAGAHVRSCPAAGWVSTPMANPALESEAFQRKVLPRMPVGRWGTPSEFGALAVYLASPASAFHTADAITVDGGYMSF